MRRHPVVVELTLPAPRLQVTLASLRLIVAHTRLMMIAARDGEWADVAQLDLERRALPIDEPVPAGAPDPTQSAQRDSLIAELTGLDAELLRHAQEHRQQLSTRLRQRRTAQRAQSAYRATAPHRSVQASRSGVQR